VGAKPFHAGGGDLRELCEQRERTRSFRLFEAYDLEGSEKISYEQLSNDYGLPVTDVTNALAWARREFRKNRSRPAPRALRQRGRIHREARAAFGWDAK